jgi:hypothetical protein
MTQPLLRALIFAVLALVTWAIASTVVALAVFGLPQPGEAMAAFQARVQGPAQQVDMVVGALVLFLFGWLAARPFAGSAALRTAALLAVLYIVIEFGAAYLFTGGNRIDIAQSALAYGVKAAAALAGGFLAGRRSAPGVSLDKA